MAFKDIHMGADIEPISTTPHNNNNLKELSSESICLVSTDVAITIGIPSSSSFFSKKHTLFLLFYYFLVFFHFFLLFVNKDLILIDGCVKK